jgi:hypothetical protein
LIKLWRTGEGVDCAFELFPHCDVQILHAVVVKWSRTSTLRGLVYRCKTIPNDAIGTTDVKNASVDACFEVSFACCTPNEF